MSLHLSQPFILFSNTFDGIGLIVIGGLVLIGWCVVFAKHRKNVLSNNPRLGYLIGDVFVLVPGCIASGIGLLNPSRSRWAPLVLLIVVGAAAFDLTHTFIYCAEIDVPKWKGAPLPTWVYAAVIIVVMGILEWIAWSDIRIESHSVAPPLFFWLAIVASLGMIVAVILGTAAVRKSAVTTATRSRPFG